MTVSSPKVRPIAVALLLVLAVPAASAAQGRSDPGPGPDAIAVAEDPFGSDVGANAAREMTALMEVTILNIDVLTLTVRVDAPTRARLDSLVAGRRYSDELADSVAAVMLEADRMWARQVLHRDVSYGRMLGGMRETSEKAADAGYISAAYLERFSASLPELFGFLEEDGASEGDEIFFLVEGDSVRTLYRTVDGRVLLDRTAVDPEGRRGSVPSFFAPDTRFRKRLVESLTGER